MHDHPQHLQGVAMPPKSGQKAKSVVVLLHGVGADGRDLMGLAPYWAPSLPDTEFIAPDGPFAYDMAPMGRQWFSLSDKTPAVRLAGIREAAIILDHFLDEQLAARGLDESKLALVGFSQGAMMSLHVGTRRAKAPACIVAYSGRLPSPEVFAAEVKVKPPTLLVHGETDPIVPFAGLADSEKALAAQGVPVQTLARPGLGHSIDEEGLKQGGAFLTKYLGGK